MYFSIHLFLGEVGAGRAPKAPKIFLKGILHETLEWPTPRGHPHLMIAEKPSPSQKNMLFVNTEQNLLLAFTPYKK